jgi:FHA domain-containing protein
MIRCNNCGTNNLDGSDYCDECGMKLDLSPPSATPSRDEAERPLYQPPSAVPENSIPPQQLPSPQTQDSLIPAPPSFTTSTNMPKPAMPARDGRRGEGARQPGNAAANGGNNGGHEATRSDNGESKPSAHTFALSSRGRTDVLQNQQNPPPSGDKESAAKLVIERGGRLGREFPIVGIETSIGRWDADSGIFPDIDLDEDDPEAKISRRHARIIRHNGQFLIEDLGSTNGTFINRGRRLLPGKRHVLQHGDEVIVGKTFLKFHVLT